MIQIKKIQIVKKGELIGTIDLITHITVLSEDKLNVVRRHYQQQYKECDIYFNYIEL